MKGRCCTGLVNSCGIDWDAISVRFNLQPPTKKKKRKTHCNTPKLQESLEAWFSKELAQDFTQVDKGDASSCLEIVLKRPTKEAVERIKLNDSKTRGPERDQIKYYANYKAKETPRSNTTQPSTIRSYSWGYKWSKFEPFVVFIPSVKPDEKSSQNVTSDANLTEKDKGELATAACT